MGLGPPVCLKCMRAMDLTDRSPAWWCPQCGISCLDEGNGHLFCLDDEQVQEVDKNSGTNFHQINLDYREALAKLRNS